MKRFTQIISLLSISTAIILAGCGGGGSDNAEFWAADMESYEYYKVSASLHSEGKYCKIYVEDDSRYYVNDSIINFVIDEFDTKIYPKITSKFGKESDVDGNGKIVLLILDIRDGFSGNGGYIAGYFDSTNTYSKSSNYYSNECDMIYLDCYPAEPETEGFQETVAHEFQHLVNYTQKGLDGGTEQATWINEGLSSAAEYVYSGNHLSERVEYYNTYQSDKSTGNNFYKWSNELIDYSTVYLFFQWLRIHSIDGDAIYKDILDSSYTDYRAVVEQIKSHLSSYYGSITISNSAWTDIMIDWLIANQINKTSGKHGYNGEITSLTKMQTSGGTKYLYPYQGIMKTIASQYTPGSPGANVIYRGVNSEGTIIDDTSPYEGSYILAINTDSSTTGYDKDAPFPLWTETTNLRLSKTFSDKKIYRIGAVLSAPGTTNSLENRKALLESDAAQNKENE